MRHGSFTSLDDLREKLTAFIDPVNFAGHISPRPVLMVNGTEDMIIPKACAEALHQAAGEPKKIIWYDGGHLGVPPDVVQTIVQWLVTEVRSTPDGQ